MEKDNSLIFLAIVLYPSSFLTKAIYHKIDKDSPIFAKIKNEGLIHITSPENVDSILNSKEIYASSYIRSYGKKRTFFCAGNPDFDTFCAMTFVNKKLCGIRIWPSEEEIMELSVRDYNDYSITCIGNMNLQNKKVEKVYYGLDVINGKLEYREISYQDYLNYDSLAQKDLIQKCMAFRIRCLIIGIKKEILQLEEKPIRIFLEDETGGIRLNSFSRR